MISRTKNRKKTSGCPAFGIAVRRMGMPAVFILFLSAFSYGQIVGPVRKQKIDKKKDKAYWMKRLEPGDVPASKVPPAKLSLRPDQMPLVKRFPKDLVVVGEVGKTGAKGGHYTLTRLQLERMATAGFNFSTEGMNEQEARNMENQFEFALRDTLYEWCIVKTIASGAKINGLRVTEAEVDVKMAELSRLAGGGGNQPGVMIGIDPNRMRAELTEALLVEKFIMDQINRRPAAALEALYNQAPSYYATPRRMHAWQIFRRIDPIMPEEEVKDKRKDFYKLRKDLAKKKGGNFQEMAREESDDPLTRERGGDMGWVDATPSLTKSENYRKMIEVLMKMKPGEVSDIVKTDKGFYVFYVSEIQAPTGQTFDEHAKKRVIDLQVSRFKKSWGPILMKNAKFPVKMNTSGLRVIGHKLEPKKKPAVLIKPAIPALPDF